MALVVEFVGPRQVAVNESPVPALPPGNLRIRTRYSGISAGTELTAYRGTNPYLTRTWNPQTHLFSGCGAGISYPVAGWGYSEVGDVVEIAPDVAGTPGAPAVGDLVWGIWGHRGEAVLPLDRIAGHTVPTGLSPLAASFARVGAIALNAVLAADVHLGEYVAVFGQGVLGLLCTRLATLNGADVIAVDPLASRRERSTGYGAWQAIGPGNAAEAIRDATGGQGADVAIEISGSYPALHEAIRAVGVDGRVVAAGFYQGEAGGLRLGEEFHHNRVRLISSQIGGVPSGRTPQWSQERLQRTFLRLAAAGRVDVLGLVSHVLPVRRAAEAYEVLDRSPDDAMQIVLEF